MTEIPVAANENNLLSCRISDEELEIAGKNEKTGIYTLASCTGLSVCPG
jgi:hypothetical protein